MKTVKLFLWVLTAALLMSVGGAAWGAEPRVAVAAEGTGADAAVSAVAARAPVILIFDGAGRLVASHANPAASAPGGAGPALARWLAGQGVTTLIAGDFGDKLGAALAEDGIRALAARGSAAQAVREALR